MPSHIFTRVGALAGVDRSNRASARAAQEALRDNTIGLRSYESLHAYDYMMYAFMQLARDRDARGVMETSSARASSTWTTSPARSRSRRSPRATRSSAGAGRTPRRSR